MKNPTSVISSYRDVYLEIKEIKSNPAATFLYGVYFKIFPSKIQLREKPSFSVLRAPRILLSKYMEQVDLNKVKKRNVILLLVESLRKDQLKSFGGNISVMPYIDKLAQHSICYTDTYTQASHSNYADLCTLSSHYPLRSREMYFYPKKSPYPKVLIYDILKQIGYKTAIISSQNENWCNMSNYLASQNLDYFFHSETFKGPTYTPEGDTGFAAFANKSKMSGKIDDKYTVDEAIRWIDSVGNKPFFIYMNLQNSHIPYQIPDSFQRKFSPDKIDFQIRFGDFPKDKIDVVKGRYADSLRYVDYQFNRVIEHLRNNGLLNNTIIIVTGDTGQAFYEHGFASHACPVYNEVMQVPLFFNIPDEDPRSDNRPAQHIDIPPTLLHFLNLPVHPSFQGIDLERMSILSGRSRYVLTQMPLFYQFGVIRDNYKFIYSPQYRNIKLFDLINDPKEKIDIKNKFPYISKQLEIDLNAWIFYQVSYYEKSSLYNNTYPPDYIDRGDSLRKPVY